MAWNVPAAQPGPAGPAHSARRRGRCGLLAWRQGTFPLRLVPDRIHGGGLGRGPSQGLPVLDAGVARGLRSDRLGRGAGAATLGAAASATGADRADRGRGVGTAGARHGQARRLHRGPVDQSKRPRAAMARACALSEGCVATLQNRMRRDRKSTKMPEISYPRQGRIDCRAIYRLTKPSNASYANCLIYIY